MSKDDENFCSECERHTLKKEIVEDKGILSIEHFCSGCGFYNVFDPQPDPQLGLGELFILADFDTSFKMGLNRIVSVMGPPGTGKSYTGIKIGSKTYDGFTIDDIVFSGLDYIKAIKDKNRKPGSFIMWDDAGAGAPARKYMSAENIGVGIVAQVQRFRKLRVWTTIPDREMLDSQPRKIVDIHLEFQKRIPDKPISCRIYYPEYNSRRKKMYFPHPRFHDPKRGPRALSIIEIKDPPKKSLADAYEDKKQSYFMDDFIPDLIKNIEDGTGDTDNRTERYLVLLCEYSDQLGQTRKQLAKILGVRPDSLSRAYQKYKTRLESRLKVVPA